MTNFHVVRNLGSNKTHVMDVTGSSRARVFGADYTRPHDGLTACGVRIWDGVLMQASTVVKCRPCVHVTGITCELEEDA